MLRTTAAILAGKAARIAGRARGGGSAMPGLVAERIDPRLLTRALERIPRGVLVVTGTNGKTTTTRILAAILRAHGLRVFTNPTGSNFTRGVISSMLGQLPWSGRLDADVAVLELDEWHALRFAEVVTPTHALLLNVARDQLDRFAEIDTTARLLEQLAVQASVGVVINRDDSFVARIGAQISPQVVTRWFGVDPQIADSLPPLHEADVRFDEDFVAPGELADAGLLHPLDEASFEILLPGPETIGPVTLRQRGLAAMINATAATTAAQLILGSDFRSAATQEALRTVTPPFGRGEVIDAGGQPLELVLVKNPAGFTVALGTYGAAPVATMIAINDDYADGQDVSWLYDVGFESLRDAGVDVCSGVRGYDMALRLDLEDVPVGHVDLDLEHALDAFIADHPDEPRRIFCTYTAMMALRRLLAARYGLAAFGEDPR